MILLLAGCSDEPAAEAPEEESRLQVPAPRSAPAAAEPAEPTEPAPEATDAAEVLRLYYDHVQNRRYRQAHALREARTGDDVEAFAAHFDRFASHKATLGKPSDPVAAGEWLYVELPVQVYGTLKDGKPFGSAGTITLRRAKQGGPWRIYTKG
jgi:hypothetical protein